MTEKITIDPDDLTRLDTEGRNVHDMAVDEDMPDSESVTIQLTATALRYQPFVPCVPETVGVMTGGVESATTMLVVASAVDLGDSTLPTRSLAKL
jgi:hypothetical protein